MSSRKAAQRAYLDRDDLLLLHAIGGLEEVENHSTLVLQELLQHKQPVLSQGSPLNSLATGRGTERRLDGLVALRQVLWSQQASSTHNLQGQSHDSSSRTCKNHLFCAEPHPNPSDRLPTSDSLLSQALACPLMSSSGLMSSGELIDHLAVDSKGMTLPALCSEPFSSRKTSVCASRGTKRASLRSSTKRSPTLSTQYSPSEHGTIDSSCDGPKKATSLCTQQKKCITANHFMTERQRREFLNEKYQILRSLIPNPTKADRASIVQDAIDHVNELKEQVEKLRFQKGLRDGKRQKVADKEGMGSYGGESSEERSCELGQHLPALGNHCEEGKLHVIQAQMKSKYGTSIDIRVVDDEATIKVAHRHSQDSFLLVAVLTLHEAQMELLHASGARIGNHNVYMLNVKIAKGKFMGATQIAKQLLECFDAMHAASSPC